MEDSTPEHSIAQFKPSLALAVSLIFSASSLGVELLSTTMVRTSGTRVLAKARRDSERSVRTMGVAPAALAARSVTSPMGPAPLSL